MSTEVKQDPIENEIVKFEFTVAQINAILAILGQAPFVASANLISLIQRQGEPQFRALMDKKNES